MSKHVILFGSSLNPMTQAHVAIIRKLSENYSNCEIRIVPVYKHPDPKALAPYADRVQMARRVMQREQVKGKMDNVVVSDVEEAVYQDIYNEICLESVCATIGKPFVSYEKALQSAELASSKQVYYSTQLKQELLGLETTNPDLYKKCQENIAKLGVRTYRLLDYLKNKEQDTEFSFAFGGDTLGALLAGNWSNGDVIIKQCAQLIYVNRPGAEILEIKSTSTKPEVHQAITAAINEAKDRFKPLEVFAANDHQLKNVSSTEFREFRVSDPELVKTVPYDVLAYSYNHQLYGFSADFCSEATVTAWYKAKKKISGDLSNDDKLFIGEELQRRSLAQCSASNYTERLIELKTRDERSATSLMNNNNSLFGPVNGDGTNTKSAFSFSI